MRLPALFPTPQKISETGNSFTLPQELHFFCSDDSLSEGITPLVRKTCYRAGKVDRTGKPRYSKRKFWASRSILSEIGKRPDYAEDGKLNWRIPSVIQGVSGISVSRGRYPNARICDRGRSEPEPARIYARYQQVQGADDGRIISTNRSARPDRI